MDTAVPTEPDPDFDNSCGCQYARPDLTETANSEHLKRFREEFKALTGNLPFPWQECLFVRFAAESFPPNINLPTGTGKTSIMAIWLLALAEKLSGNPRQDAIPRRLIWVVNRRVVVDQATREAEQLRQKLNDVSVVELEPVRCALKQLSESDSADLLGISTLRGQFEDNAEWSGDPSRPAVIVGTVDMIGSRLLFSGYGIGFKAKPLHAGFLGQDALLVHDEAHLEHPFQQLLIAIQNEQGRCREFGKFHLMALSATSRTVDEQGDSFRLTEIESLPPETIPDSAEPLPVLWRRLKANKAICLHKNDDEEKLADQIAAQALNLRDSKCAVLVFARKIEHVEKIVSRLRGAKQPVQPLTGTQRGYERNRLVAEDPIFQRFLSGAGANAATAYLVCTSAGEVGVNISADHLVCDLSTFDSMIQRFGRVNRFGHRIDTKIHILYPAEFKKDDDLDDRRMKTLELIRSLQDDASPKAIGELNPKECLAAFAPTPTVLPASDILLDFWSLTTIKGRFPGRPPVGPYLHGLSADPPETHVAWREEVGVITGELLKQYDPEDLFEDYPLKPHELLRDRSDRIYKRLCKLAERFPDAPVWLRADDGDVEPRLTLGKLKEGGKDKIDNITVLLPPSAGGLSKEGLLEDADKADDVLYDVADEWRDINGKPVRTRIWDADPDFAKKVNMMRLIRTIHTYTGPSAEAEEGEASNPRDWSWYELPKSGDNDGSRSAPRPVLWQVHTEDVVENAARIVKHLPLSQGLREAIVVAARLHDLGKRRPLFQRILGNMKLEPLLAKSGRKKQPYSMGKNYRHEFASLLDIQKEPEFQSLNEELRDLVAHLIAAHHGRGRPHFPTDEAYDPEATENDASTVATRVPQRFAKLQRKYGRWGLAYLESLLRAADWAASANPSKYYEGEG